MTLKNAFLSYRGWVTTTPAKMLTSCQTQKTQKSSYFAGHEMGGGGESDKLAHV